MDEQKVRELYQELYAQFSSIKAKVNEQGGNVSKKLSDQLNEMETLLTKLKQKAKEAGIDVKAEDNVAFTDNSNDDWMQTIDCSDSPEEIKKLLKKHIISLGKFPTAKEAFDIIEQIDKYYEANVSSPNDKRVINTFISAFNKKPESDLAQIIKSYRSCAYWAIIEGIENMKSDFKLDASKDFHPVFERAFKEGNAPEIDVPLQFKWDIAERKFGKPTGVGFLYFEKPTIQFSFKFGFWKNANLLRTSNEQIFGDWINSFTQEFRSTVTLPSLGNILNKQMNFKGSSNIFTKGIAIPFPSIGTTFVIKADFIGMKWADIGVNFDKKEDRFSVNDLVPSLGAVRFQADVDMKNFYTLIGKPLNSYLSDEVTLDRAVVTLSIGCKVSIDGPKLSSFYEKKYAKVLNEKAQKKAGIIKDKISDADEKFIKSLQSKSDELVENAKELRSLVDKIDRNKPDTKLKKVIDTFQDKTGKLYEDFNKKVWDSKAGREAAEKVVIETGEKVAKIIGKNTLKLMAKAASKTVPIIGTAITIVEIGMLVYDFYVFFLSDDSGLRWEDRVDKWLRGL